MKLERKKFIIFFIVMFTQATAANLVHPVTPSIIINLNLPTYMFGATFSAMSATNFFFSSFWGKVVDYVGSRKILFLCCIGYAIGQILFLISMTSFHILLARMISGLFVGGVMVSQMTYIVKYSKDEDVGKNLTSFATITAVGGANGYMIGGIIGKFSIELPFIIQSILLVLCGFLFFLVINKNVDGKISFKRARGIFFKSSPINTFYEIRPAVTKNLGILSIIVFISTFGTICQDQNFNFYIRDIYNLDSSYNGFIKSIVAVTGLILNITLCNTIISKGNIKKSLTNIFLFIMINAFLIFFIDDLATFIIINIVYYGFNIVYIPLLQYLFTSSTNKLTTGTLMGYYNSLKSLGMIFGSLFAGIIYDYGFKLPFALCGLLFGVCVILLVFIKK